MFHGAKVLGSQCFGERKFQEELATWGHSETFALGSKSYVTKVICSMLEHVTYADIP